LAVNEVLERFEKQDKLKADLVTLRYFAGLSIRNLPKHAAFRRQRLTAVGLTLGLGCSRSCDGLKRSRPTEISRGKLLRIVG
jgi:hypothetical protein